MIQTRQSDQTIRRCRGDRRPHPYGAGSVCFRADRAERRRQNYNDQDAHEYFAAHVGARGNPRRSTRGNSARRSSRRSATFPKTRACPTGCRWATSCRTAAAFYPTWDNDLLNALVRLYGFAARSQARFAVARNAGKGGIRVVAGIPPAAHHSRRTVRRSRSVDSRRGNRIHARSRF